MPPRIRILALASFATGTQAFVFGGVLDRLAEDLGVSIAAAGQLSTLYALAFAAAAPFAGALAGGLERRRLLVCALAGLAALNLAAAAAPSFQALAALRVACGLAATLTAPIAAAAAASLAPPEARGRAMSVVLGGMTVALVAGIPLGSLVGDLLGWRACFLFAAALAATAALAIGLTLPRAPSPDRAGLRGLGAALRPAVHLHLGVTFACLTAVFCMSTYIAPIVARVTGLEGAGVGAMQVCSGLGAIAGAALGGRNADLERPEAFAGRAFAVLIATLLLQGALLSAAPAGGGAGGWAATGLLGAAFFLGAAAVFCIMPLLQRRLAEAAPGAAAVALSLNGAMAFLGQAAGGALGGAAIAAGGLPWTAAAGAAAGLGALGLFRLAARRVRDPFPA